MLQKVKYRYSRLLLFFLLALILFSIVLYSICEPVLFKPFYYIPPDYRLLIALGIFLVIIGRRAFIDAREKRNRDYYQKNPFLHIIINFFIIPLLFFIMFIFILPFLYFPVKLINIDPPLQLIFQLYAMLSCFMIWNSIFPVFPVIFSLLFYYLIFFIGKNREWVREICKGLVLTSLYEIYILIFPTRSFFHNFRQCNFTYLSILFIRAFENKTSEYRCISKVFNDKRAIIPIKNKERIFNELWGYIKQCIFFAVKEAESYCNDKTYIETNEIIKYDYLEKIWIIILRMCSIFLYVELQYSLFETIRNSRENKKGGMEISPVLFFPLLKKLIEYDGDNQDIGFFAGEIREGIKGIKGKTGIAMQRLKMKLEENLPSDPVHKRDKDKIKCLEFIHSAINDLNNMSRKKGKINEPAKAFTPFWNNKNISTIEDKEPVFITINPVFPGLVLYLWMYEMQNPHVVPQIISSLISGYDYPQKGCNYNEFHYLIYSLQFYHNTVLQEDNPELHSIMELGTNYMKSSLYSVGEIEVTT
ncbi:MAG: hypothetical protein JXB88_01620 [Spirochaetales bacterium]|nr:hypothetical protein [Spirochaetales bacterium]